MPVSDTARGALYAPATDQAFIELMEIFHPDLPATLRFANAQNDVEISGDDQGGDVYQAWAFEALWPDASADKQPEARVAFDNTSPTILAVLRSLTVRPTVTFKMVRAADVNTVEQEWNGLEIVRVTADAARVTLHLTLYNLADEGVFSRFDRRWPGLWPS